jgi:hypothetical protein
VNEVGSGNAATGARVTRPGAVAPGTVGFDWLLTGLAGIVALGGYLVVKGGRAGTLDAETLVSVQALILYAGAIPTIILLVWAAIAGRGGEAPGRAMLPPAYQPALVGALAFIGGLALALLDIGGPLDVDIVAALVSPGALLLAAGATLIASGPVLSFGHRSLRSAGPVSRTVAVGLAVSTAWLLSIPTLFIAVAHPWVTGAGLGLSDEPPFAMHTDLYALPLEGAGTIRLTATSDEDEVHPAVHPDGDRIAVGRGPAVDGLDVWVLAMDGTEIARVTDTPDANEDGLTWSPDGSRLAWWSDRPAVDATAAASPAPEAAPAARADAPAAPPGGGVAGTVDTWIADADGTGAAPLAHPATDEGVESWSPDGARLCGWIFAADEWPDVATFGLDGSEPVHVTDDPGEDWSCSWSPNGDRLAYHSTRDGDYEIHTIAPDGSDDRQLTDDDGMDMLPRWSPDGRSIAFISDASGEIEVYVMDADGGNVRNVSRDPSLDDGIYGIDWTPDGSTIVAASMGRAYAPGEDASFRAAVGAIALASIVLGLVVGLVLRYRPRLGTFTIALGLTGLLVALLGDSLAPAAAFVVAGLATDGIGAWASAAPGSARAGVTGGIAAIVLIVVTFVAGGLEDGLSWGGERLVGAALLAGLLGAACAAIACRPVEQATDALPRDDAAAPGSQA